MPNPTTPAPPALSTEERILQAATHVFVRNGYAGTKTRDIAEEAGINVATLHYYFRTKEKLFSVVAKESMKEFASVFHRAFAREGTMEDKVKRFVDGHIDLLLERPYLASFCIQESERDPEGYKDTMDFRNYRAVMQRELDAMAERNEARPITPDEFIVALVGMTIYPFLSRNTTMYSAGMDEAAYRAHTDRVRVMIPEMIMGWLRGA